RGRRARARATGATGRRGPAARVPPRGILGLHGHLQGRAASQRSLDGRHGPLEPMGLNDDGVLVTGAYGLLGSWLVKALLDRDMRVVVIKRDAPSWSPLELMDLERRV